MPNESIVIVEDEKDILKLLEFNLGKEGYRVKGFLSGEDGLKAIQKITPDLVILDLMLPGIDGLTICRQIRSDSTASNLPIIMLTAKDSEIDIVTGLELGANDYITKPFSIRVLIARIRTILRQTTNRLESNDGSIKVNEITINPGRHEVFVKNDPVMLTSTEFRLLWLLISRPGWVFDRDQIIDAIHGNDYVVTDRSIDVHFVGLRKKLGRAGKYIETIRGVGYRLKDKQI